MVQVRNSTSQPSNPRHIATKSSDRSVVENSYRVVWLKSWRHQQMLSTKSAKSHLNHRVVSSVPLGDLGPSWLHCDCMAWVSLAVRFKSVWSQCNTALELATDSFCCSPRSQAGRRRRHKCIQMSAAAFETCWDNLKTVQRCWWMRLLAKTPVSIFASCIHSTWRSPRQSKSWSKQRWWRCFCEASEVFSIASATVLVIASCSNFSCTFNQPSHPAWWYRFCWARRYLYN